MGADQGRKLEKLLEETRRAGLFRVVMLHHPPVTRGVKFGRGLTDARRFELILRKAGGSWCFTAIITFLGSADDWPGCANPVVGVGSASAVPGTAQHLAEYNLIRIIPGSEQAVHIERRGITFENRTVARIGLMTL